MRTPENLYVDFAATAPTLPSVREAMVPWLGTEFGNPSSLHAVGARAKRALDEVRERVSRHLGCLFGEVTFTSSGTEAANLAIIGSALYEREHGDRRRMLFSASEHHCVLHTAPLLEALGFSVELVPTDALGRVDLDALHTMLGPDVALVATMHANNELGTFNPVPAVVAAARAEGARVLVDAVQTFAHLKDVLDADFVTGSAHKFGGPKGVGVLYARSGVKLKPWAVGGGQERELRAGTENVAGIVGLAQALMDWPKDYAGAREAFWTAWPEDLGHRTVPPTEPCLPGHAHLRTPGVPAESLLIWLDRQGVAASSGAACSSGSLEPSHVLLACGLSVAEASEGLRITFGPDQGPEVGRQVASVVAEGVSTIRSARWRA